MPEYVTTGQVAQSLGVAEHRLHSLIRARVIAAPSLQAGRRQWSNEDVRRVREALVARGAISTADAAK